MIVEIELAVVIVLLAWSPVVEWLEGRKPLPPTPQEQEQATLAAEHAEYLKMRAAIEREKSHEVNS
jgi:hypothetical protein